MHTMKKYPTQNGTILNDDDTINGHCYPVYKIDDALDILLPEDDDSTVDEEVLQEIRMRGV